MCIHGRLESELLLQEYLFRGRVEKVAAPHDLRNGGLRIVDCCCQLVGIQAVPAANYEITHIFSQGPHHLPQETVTYRDDSVSGDSDAKACSRCGVHCSPGACGLATAIGCECCAGTATVEQIALFIQAVQRLLIARAMVTLVVDGPVKSQPVGP